MGEGGGERLVFSLLYTIRPSPNCQECCVAPPLPPPNSISDEILTVSVCLCVCVCEYLLMGFLLLFFIFLDELKCAEKQNWEGTGMGFISKHEQENVVLH